MKKDLMGSGQEKYSISPNDKGLTLALLWKEKY
jgi:hypothetical protein